MRGELSVAQIADLLEATCAHLQSDLVPLGDEVARWHPKEGEWCINEVLGHLIEAEKRGVMYRIRRALEEDRPRTESWDQVGIARERRDCDRLVLSLVMELTALRKQSVETVRALRPEQLDRACLHGTAGELHVRDMLHHATRHDRDHTRQILSNEMAWLWPHIGNAQRFATE
jgi:DinB family protein